MNKEIKNKINFKKKFYLLFFILLKKKMIKSNELMKIINGSEVLDFDSLEKKCNYENGYTKDTPVC
jgi:hypothetical protein